MSKINVLLLSPHYQFFQAIPLKILEDQQNSIEYRASIDVLPSENHAGTV